MITTPHVIGEPEGRVCLDKTRLIFYIKDRLNLPVKRISRPGTIQP